MDDQPSDKVPSPDPTRLTTAQLNREIANLRELLEMIINGKVEFLRAELGGIKENFVTRLTDIDRAIALREKMVDSWPASFIEKIEALRALHNERFTSIQTQFKERDVRMEQNSRDAKIAVDAALQAAKEAVTEQNRSSSLAISKSDSATTKQIDTMGTMVQSAIAGLNLQIGDVKERITRIEGEGKGMVNETSRVQVESGAHHAVNANVIGVVGLVVGSLIGLGGLLVAFFDSSSKQAAAPMTSAATAQVPQIIVVPSLPATKP